jgi:DNA-binding transcriptional LysR family regulator
MSANDWASVEVRHLLALRAVAQSGSFSRAAEALGYTQSAISQQIAMLERLVGLPLFERRGGRRQVVMSEAGELLLRHAGVVLDRLQAAKADLSAFSEGAKGTLRIGAYESVSARILPAILGVFAAKWPDVDIHLRDSSNEELLTLVEAGDLDLAFVMDSEVLADEFHATALLQDPYVLLVPVDSPLADRQPVPLEDLGDCRFVAHDTMACQVFLESSLRRLGFEQRIVLRSSDNATVQGLVAAGLGIAIVPLLTVDENDPKVLVRQVDPPLPSRTIVIANHPDRYLSPAAQGFLEIARQVGAELGGWR